MDLQELQNVCAGLAALFSISGASFAGMLVCIGKRLGHKVKKMIKIIIAILVIAALALTAIFVWTNTDPAAAAAVLDLSW